MVLTKIIVVLIVVESCMVIDTQKLMVKIMRVANAQLDVRVVIDTFTDLEKHLEVIFSVLSTYELLFMDVENFVNIKTHDC